MRSRGLTAGLVLTALLAARAHAADSLASLSYSGRLADAQDVAVQGPVDLELRFYDQASGGTPLPVTAVTRAGVELVDGVFQVDVTELTPAELDLVFDGTGGTWVEITDKTHGVSYPRQQLTAVPYALKVPVDGETIGFNGDGQLSVRS